MPEDGVHSPIVIMPVGRVRNEVTDTGKRDWIQVVSEITLDPRLEEGLDGLEEFSHIMVLFWMHHAPPDVNPLKIHPQMRADLPLVGVFATRSPMRPNPLGISVVRLLERKGNVVKVVGLDAIDGTPVLDIKPYIPSGTPASATVPPWVHKLHHTYGEGSQSCH